MITITVEDAGKDLNRLIDQVRAGEEVLITSDDQPVAKIVAVAKSRQPRTPGRLQGQVDLPDAFFFDPLSADELRLWSGEGDEPK
jgi:prevent-host-death family protein